MRFSVLILASLITLNLLASETNTNKRILNQETQETNPDIIFKKGIQKGASGDINSAIEILEKLLSYNTSNVNYYIYLGYLYYVQGNYDKSIEILVKANTLNDNIVIVHLILGEIYYQINDIIKARSEFEKVISLDNSIKLAHIRLYELYKNNNPEIANSHYITIFQLPPTKIEKYLPEIEKIGSIKLPLNKSIILTKETKISRQVKTDESIIENILSDTETDSTNKEKIITTVRKSKLKFSLNFLKTPLKNFDKEKFYVKLTEFVIVMIILFIYSFFEKRKEKAYENVVLNRFRITTKQYNSKEK